MTGLKSKMGCTSPPMLRIVDIHSGKDSKHVADKIPLSLHNRHEAERELDAYLLGEDYTFQPQVIVVP